MALMRGGDAMRRVIEALGLSGHQVNRLVIVCDVNDVVTCYVRKYVHEEEMDAIADNLVEPPAKVQITTVGGLEVDEQGRAFVPVAEYARMKKALEQIASIELGGNDTSWAVAMRETARRALLGRK